MNGKKWKILLQIAMIGCMMGAVIGLSGCSEKDSALSEKEIYEVLNAINNYKAELRVTFFSNQGENEYELMQYADQQGRYRMEILQPDTYEGTATICDGEQVVQMDPSIGASVSAKESSVRSNLILYGFLSAYAADTGHRIEWFPESKEVLLSAAQSESHIIRKMELTLAADTAAPQKLEMKGADGQLLIRIEYQSFEGNTELPESLFMTK